MKTLLLTLIYRVPGLPDKVAPAKSGQLPGSAWLTKLTGLVLFLSGILGAYWPVLGQTITTSAGSYAVSNPIAKYSGDGGQATSAGLNNPNGIAFDATGNMFFCDQGNNVVRMVNSSGIITTVVGTTYVVNYDSNFDPTNTFSGDGGNANQAHLSGPSALAFDAAGNLYVADMNNNVVRKVMATGGVISGTSSITTVAGIFNINGAYTGENVAATAARLYGPAGLAFDAAGNLYIADRDNFLVRKVTTGGIISTIAGTTYTPTYNSNFDPDNSFAGDGGPANAARFYQTTGLAFDAAGNLFISDRNNVVRKVIATGGVITPTSTITTAVGSYALSGFTGGFSGDGGPATGARLSAPNGLMFDARGSLYIADFGNNVIRKVTPAGIISTVAGTTVNAPGYSGDNGAATGATMSGPTSLGRDSNYNLFIADQGNNVIRKITNLLTPPATVSIAAAGLTSVCEGSPFTLTAVATNFSPTTFTWSSTPAGITGTGSILSATAPDVSVNTAYTITVTATDGVDSPTGTFTFTVGALPTVSINRSASAVCQGQPVSLTAIASPAGIYSYGWSGSPTTPSNTSIVSATINSASHNYAIIITSQLGCTATQTTTIAGNANPAVTINRSATGVCQGQPVSLTAIGSPSANLTYSWSGSPTSPANSSVVNATITSANASFSVLVTDANSCTARNSTSITGFVTPTVSISASAPSACLGSAISLTALATPGGSYTYAWSGAATTPANSNIVSATITSASQTFSVLVSSTNGCTATSTQSIGGNANPGLSLVPSSATVCFGSVVSLSAIASPSPTNTFTWSGASTSPATGSVVATTITTASQTYSVAVTDANGCSANTSLTVYGNPNPVVSVNSPSTSVCQGQTISLTAVGSPAGTFSYQWSGATVTPANTAVVNALINSATQSYSVLLTDANNCTATGTTSITGLVSPAVTINQSAAAVCLGQPVTLTAIALPAGTYAYTWSGASTSPVNASVVSSTITTVQQNYAVLISATNGCTATATASVSGSSVGAVTVTSSGNLGCGLSSVNLSVTASGANSYTVTGPGGFSQTNGTGLFTITQEGQYAFIAGNGIAGCQSSTTRQFTNSFVPSATNNTVSGVLSCANPVVTISTLFTGTSVVVTGPANYVFSNVFRLGGQYAVNNIRVTKPGMYTITVYSGNCPPAVYTIQVSGTACP